MTLVYIFIAFVIVFGVVRIAYGAKLSSLPANATDEDIKKMATEGKNAILAMKWYRELHGVGLKEAKTAVEQMIVDDAFPNHN